MQPASPLPRHRQRSKSRSTPLNSSQQLVGLCCLLLPIVAQGFFPTARPPPWILRPVRAEAAAGASSFEPRRTPETLRAFEAWLLRRGGLDLSAAPVALRLDPRGGSSITLTTTRPIERDQIVLAVPQPLLLTTALPPPLAAAARAAGLDPLGRLALRLLAEAAAAAAGVVEGGGDDTWGPYLRVLPRREDMHLPILWDDAEEEEQGQGRPSSPPPSVVGPPPQLLPLLAPSPLHDDVVECRLAMRAELTDLREALFLLRSTDKEKEGERVLRLLDWRHWTWARAVAMSRPYILDPDEQARAEQRQHHHDDSNSAEEDSPSSSSLTLIPVVDMADHCDAVKYGVQRGDGVFTHRSDVQLVADRAYPTAGLPYWNTYGPGLSSASKLYSFGYLETLFLPTTDDNSDAAGSGSGPGAVVVPLQGTALFVVGLNGAQDDDEVAKALWDAKAAVLASLGLRPQGQRLEVATRTRVTGRGLAMVAIEDHVTAPGLLTGEGEGDEGDEEVDGGVERLLRYLRLKHLGALGLERLADGVDAGGEEGRKRMWARLGSGRWRGWVDVGVEVAAGLEAVALCQEGLRRVGPQLERALGVVMEEGDDGVGDGGYRHRLGLCRTLLHGEVLALRAVAELAMAGVEAADGGV